MCLHDDGLKHAHAGGCDASAATAAAQGGQLLRVLLELDPSANLVRITDPDTGRLMGELDQALSEQILGDGNPDREPALDALCETLFGAVAPGAATPPLDDGQSSLALARQFAAEGGAPRKTRRKLWELPHKLHCPVIGTCLDTGELQRIARKAGARSRGDLSEYAVHVSFVGAAVERNGLSLATHKALERKFAAQVRRFTRARTPGQLAALWDEALARGDAPGGLWATLTHPACDDALRVRAYEAIHMLSHQVGAGQRADLRRLTEAEAELAELQREFDAAQRRQRRQLEDREQRIDELERALGETQRERRELQAQRAALQHDLAELRNHTNPHQVDALDARLNEAERRVAVLAQHNEALEGALSMAERELDGLQEENAALTDEAAAMERFIEQALNVCDGCETRDCDTDLGGRRILCVGGRSRLVGQYRELVARCNGRFEHYDGGIEDNRQSLETLLASADAVLCATDAVSHDAYYRLKRFCKRHDKPHVFLRTSGIGAFARGLYSIGR
jgi:hypothetical protein